MIYLAIRNDETGTVERGNYDARLHLPGVGHIDVRIEDYDRSRGWAALVRETVEALEVRYPSPGPTSDEGRE